MNVTNNVAAHQFELGTDAGTAVLQYRLRGKTINLMHTMVAEEARGKGSGEALVRAALEYARHEKLTVVPTCPFVKAFLTKHAEYADLVTPDRA